MAEDKKYKFTFTALTQNLSVDMRITGSLCVFSMLSFINYKLKISKIHFCGRFGVFEYLSCCVRVS